MFSFWRIFMNYLEIDAFLSSFRHLVFRIHISKFIMVLMFLWISKKMFIHRNSKFFVECAAFLSLIPGLSEVILMKRGQKFSQQIKNTMGNDKKQSWWPLSHASQILSGIFFNCSLFFLLKKSNKNILYTKQAQTVRLIYFVQ